MPGPEATMHLSDTLLDVDGRIDPRQWNAARAARTPVGECAAHEAAVHAGDVDVDFWQRRFYTVTCAGDGGHETVVPAGRIVRDPSVMPLFGVWANEVVLDAARERDAAILGEHDDAEPIPA